MLFRSDWGYELATSEFRDDCVTERESWILDNADRNPGLSIEANARMVDPGFDAMTPEKQAAICNEVKQVLDAIGASHGTTGCGAGIRMGFASTGGMPLIRSTRRRKASARARSSGVIAASGQE